MNEENKTTVRLADGTTIPCEGVYASPMMYLGVQRDALTFTFDPESVSVQKLLELFTPENCAEIQIRTEPSVFVVHEHYTIRVGAGMSCQDLANRMMTGGPVQNTNPAAWVTMVQSTPEERQLQSQQAALDALLINVLEG